MTSPDQHKPVNLRWWRLGGTASILALLAMLWPFGGNHQGRTEDLFLIGIAGTIAVIIISDAVLRRNGLRR